MEPDHKSSERRLVLKGRYANYFAIGHNTNEFIFDFGQSFSENDQAELFTRIITHPVYAKELFNILKDSLDQYEKEFGSID